MISSVKRGLVGLCVAGVLIGAGLAVFINTSNDTRQIDPQLPEKGTPEMAALIKAGSYAAKAGDCVACHTASGGKPFAGGLALATPIGKIYSTNITPDQESGIGKWTLDDFDRALRHGIGKDGGSLYPAMPYPSYSKVKDEDVKALYAYFMNDVQPVSEPNKASDIPWPMSMRWPLTIWRKVYGPNVPAGPNALPPTYASDRISRGAYLVQGLGHCGACHTPRGPGLQEQTLDDSSELFLAGGQSIDGWFAVNLRGNQADGLGRWSEQDIVDTLRTARNKEHAVVGSPMADVVKQSMQYMNDDDLHAIAAYLKTLTPGPEEKSKFSPDEKTAKTLAAGQDVGRGSQLYVDNCAACHQTNGKGHIGVFPAIAGNPSVLADKPESLVRLILEGSKLPSTEKAPSELGMPGFAWRMNDEEVAQLATFIRQGWGNSASAVTAAEVREVRSHPTHAQATAK